VPTLWNGVVASEDQLDFLGRHNYGHFTVFQVRRKTAPGLGLHLERLRADATELFGAAPSQQRLRALLAQAVTQEDCSVRVTVVSQELDAVLAGAVVEPEVVITTSDPRPPSTQPVAVRTASYQRETPWVKHRATHGLVRETRAARQAGFDDALFVDGQGRISEGTTWNLCLRDTGGWVWPEAEVLNGVTMRLLRAAMDAAGIPQEDRTVSAADLPGYRAAFALNATSPTKPIAHIDGHAFTSDATELEELWRSIVPEPL
jgi:branched-subunit amino acid aminotransferase/4-amino-4-deoxychorismate lyase